MTRGEVAAIPETGRAVFLDRDGVLIADVNHLTSAQQIQVLPRVPDALALLRASGWRLIIATNQSVVARGWLDERQLREIHRVLTAELAARGAAIDAVYFCPHHPEGVVSAYRRVCECRKPSPGMLLQAARDWHLDLEKSVIVGDATSDVEAGRRAGCHTVLIRDAAEKQTDGESAPPDYTAPDLWTGAAWILSHLR